uniref:RlpA-like protein double-psi beta-barrel domain-containing protein n=1 Tax=Globodera rostochiensis TaxID=31243 RepID=A0A914GZA4_GLORO
MFAANSLLLLPIMLSFISLAFCADSSLVVSPAYSTKQTCLSEASATGPISAQLKKAQKGGKFTHYGIGGRGACGLDIDTPTKSAAGSGTLFNSSAVWVLSCLPDARYLLDDLVCINKCVQIQYKQKTLTVPINNKCSECAIDHVDLSEEAFAWLEPDTSVGVATEATITYIQCP